MFGLKGMNQCDNLFLTDLRERKRERSDISQALETVKSTSLSDLDDMRNTLSVGVPTMALEIESTKRLTAA